MPGGPLFFSIAYFTVLKFAGYSAAGYYIKQSEKVDRPHSIVFGLMRTIVGIAVGITYGLMLGAFVSVTHFELAISQTRRLFLRHYPPVVGFAGPAAVGHIVRSVLARAGIRRYGRGAAHLFRHGLATKMIRRGATLSEISEVLRHRSQTTTAIYTQVSFEALRSVAQPWPVGGEQ